MSKKRKRLGGFGKRKGASFERHVCKVLSLFVSNGKSTDVFWRSAMSGGRATVQRARGVSVRQAGDICAVALEGHEFCDNWFVECKNVKDIALASFLLNNEGPLAKFWRVAQKEADHYGKQPMIIARARGAAIVVTRPQRLEEYTAAQLTSHSRNCDVAFFEDMIISVPAAVAALRRKQKGED